MALSLTLQRLQDRCMKIEQLTAGCPLPATVSSPARQSRETLWDGTEITVRDLEPEDFPSVMALADNLSGDELYLRFFTYHPHHLAEWARSVTEPAVGNVALGAFDGESLLAVGNSVAVDDAGTAEISVVVAHRNHRRGIATALLRRLAEHAKSTGTQRLTAEVLIQNRDMRQLIADAGWPCSQRRDDEVLTIEVDLADACSTGMAEPEPTASLPATCTAR